MLLVNLQNSDGFFCISLKIIGFKVHTTLLRRLLKDLNPPSILFTIKHLSVLVGVMAQPGLLFECFQG